MRTIKASEVVKGMRVEVVREYPGAKVTIEGVSRCDYGTGPTFPLTIGDQTVNVAPDHPVTVLAEPEPEWVEGAWHWVKFAHDPKRVRPLRRLQGGWTYLTGESGRAFADEVDVDVTVLGRVLIVDWPGDDVARELDEINDGNRSMSLSNYGRTTTHDTILGNVADAIRTQGGVR